MSRTVSSAFKQAIYSQETDEVFTTLLTIDHDDLTSPIRVANDWLEDLPVAGVKGVISNSVEYVAFPFEFILPPQNETGISMAKLRIDNVSREIMVSALAITSPASVNVKIVLSSDPDTIEMEIDDFKLANITANVFTIEGDLSTSDNYDLEPFPGARFDPSRFPGAF